MKKSNELKYTKLPTGKKFINKNIMNYKGVIIEESLENKSVLREVKILSTKVEKVVEKHKTPWLKQWTLYTVEFPVEKADEIALQISHDLEKKHTWYADFKNDKYHFIVYPGKIFKVDINNPVLYKSAKKYGISVGIPEYQVDFAPTDEA